MDSCLSLPILKEEDTHEKAGVLFGFAAIFGLVPAPLAVLVFGVPTAAADLGLQNVNLACNDGTNLDLALDTTSLLALADAVSVMTFFPAGDPALACSLTQSDPPPSGSGNPHYDYAVGGGQTANPFSELCPEVPVANFSFSAHVPNDTPAVFGSPQSNVGGTLTVTVPDCGHVTVRVDCLSVSGSQAGLTGPVTHATGNLSSVMGAELAVDVKDLSTGDLIFVFGFLACGAGGGSAFQPVLHGNISVHDAP